MASKESTLGHGTMNTPTTFGGIPIKHVSLVILVVQNSSLVLTMRYSRTRPGVPYLTSTAVVLSELLKCLVCTAIHLYKQHHDTAAAEIPTSTSPTLLLASDGSSSHHRRSCLTRLWKDVFSVHSGFFKLCIPAFLYTVHNNLQFIAASNLEAATFQVTYQGKILTTALFSVILLRQKLSHMKWLALLYLTFGVAAVQVSSASSSSSPSSSVRQGSSSATGFLAVAVACVLSGIAGVYFEMVLKRCSSSTSSLWLRNIQLSVASLAIALFGTLTWDWSAIRNHGGFFQGYDLLVVTTILLQACGGLIVAVVIKYADNVAKGFATSLSVIVSTVFSFFFFDLVVNPQFLEGATLVLIATYLYSVPDTETKNKVLRWGPPYRDGGNDSHEQAYRSSNEETTEDYYKSNGENNGYEKV